MEYDTITEYIEKHEKEAFELLLELAQIPAPSNHEEKRAQFCLEWLKSHRAEGAYVDEAQNVVYPVGVGEDNPVMVFAAHTDVVFPDETPLPLRVEDGCVYCPGVGDDSACVAALLMAARFVAERGLRPADAGILFVCNSGEEGLGNLKGIRQICKDYEGRIRGFVSFDCPLDEVITQAVGSQRYEIRVKTKGGHSYYDFGRQNAIAVLAGIIGQLYEIRVPQGGKTTYNVGMISGGTSVNTIAQQAAVLYEFRSERKEHLQFMEEQMEKVLDEARKNPDAELECRVVGVRPCSGDVDPASQAQLEERVIRAVETATGTRPRYKSASTDCNIPLSLGIPSACAGAYFGEGAHTREEYVRIDSLKAGYRVALELVTGFFSGV